MFFLIQIQCVLEVNKLFKDYIQDVLDKIIAKCHVSMFIFDIIQSLDVLKDIIFF